jgi:hypothetical protein
MEIWLVKGNQREKETSEVVPNTVIEEILSPRT